MNTDFQDKLIAAGVKAGDEVMVQTMAPKEAAEAVIALGAVPVFVDSEPQTGAMYAEQLRIAIRSRFAETGKMPKAVVPMAVNGKDYNKTYIAEIAERYELSVVEYDGGIQMLMPLHTLREYSQYLAFVNGVAEDFYSKNTN